MPKRVHENPSEASIFIQESSTESHWATKTQAATNQKDKEKVKILFFFFLKFPTYSQGANRNETETNRRESVASVGDEHASLPYRTVTDCDALYEPWSTHFFSLFFSPCLVSSVATRPYFQNNMLLPSNTRTLGEIQVQGERWEMRDDRVTEKYGKLGLKSHLLPAMLLWDLNYQSQAPNS